MTQTPKTAHTPEVTLITRANCPLCDEAEAVIDRVAKQIPLRLNRVDVDEDPLLESEYGSMVPVVLLNDVPVFYGKVSAVRLSQMLRDLRGNGAPKLSPRYRRHLDSLRSLLKGRS